MQESAIWTNCPICGKGIVITWPRLYVYRRGEDYLCGEDCMIVYDTKQTQKSNEKGVEKEVAAKMTQDQREEALRIAASGGDPIAYLKKLGLHNPWASWSYIREKAGKKAEVTTAKEVPEVKVVAEVPELTRMTETPEQPLNLQGGVNYQIKVEESRKDRKHFRVIGLETDYGRFTVGTIDGVLRFQAEGETEICMVTEDWLKMADQLPEILRALGVEE